MATEMSYLLCPYCKAATPGWESDTKYRCPQCRKSWKPLHPDLKSAYIGTKEDVEERLSTDGEEPWTLKELPAEIGRNHNTHVLKLTKSDLVSRKHCILTYDRIKGYGIRCCEQHRRTHINGRILNYDEVAPLHPWQDKLELADVQLELRCYFKAERGEPPSADNDHTTDVQLRDKELSYLYSDDSGRLTSSSERPQSNAIAAIITQGENTMIVALDKSRIRLNGLAFIERTLEGGEQLSIDGIDFTYIRENHLLQRDTKLKSQGVDLEITNLRASYGERPVLHNVTCHIPRSKVTAIIGRSGCGKSTLIKTLFGKKKPGGGIISVDGSTDCNYADWVTGHAALVPQFDAVHRELTVEQCVGYAADMFDRKIDGTMYRENLVTHALQETGLEAYRGQEIESLSGGQLKRVSIAAEVVKRPDLLMLDEPTTGLDYATETQILALLKQISRQGRTVIYITHSLEAIKAADHVILLEAREDGRGAEVAAEGKPSEVLKEKKYTAWEELYHDLSLENGKKSKKGPQKSAWRSRMMPTMFLRYANIWYNSPILSMLTLLGIPLILGLAISIATTTQGDRLLLGLVAMIWLSMNQTVREIVKEKTIFLHEYTGTSYTIMYLESKILFFLSLAVMQALLLVLPIYSLNFGAEKVACTPDYMRYMGNYPFVYVYGMFFLAAGVGSVLGLFISGISLYVKRKGEVVAVLLSVLFTLPQILFSDKVFDGLCNKADEFYRFACCSDHDRLAEILSFGTLTRYLYLPLKALGTLGTDNEAIFKALSFNCITLIALALILMVLLWLVLEVYVQRAKRND